MSNKTKIVVLRMKEIIYSGIFALLGVLFLVLLIIMFVPGKEKEESGPEPSDTFTTEARYHPGVYSTSVSLGSCTLDLEVMVDANNINDIHLVNLNQEVETMFPLVQPSLEDLAAQIIADQSLEHVTYPSDAKYTSLVLLEAIETSLQKAEVRNE